MRGARALRLLVAWALMLFPCAAALAQADTVEALSPKRDVEEREPELTVRSEELQREAGP